MTRLDDIRARTDAATGGHWGYSIFGVTNTGFTIQEESTWDGDPGELVEADLNFIAHARQDIPYLLALLARLDALSKPSEAAGTDGLIRAADVQRLIHEGDPE